MLTQVYLYYRNFLYIVFSGDNYDNYSITGYTQEVKKNEPVKLKVKKGTTEGTTGNTSSDTTTETDNDDDDTTSTENTDDTEVTGSDIYSDTTTRGITNIFNWNLN